MDMVYLVKIIDCGLMSGPRLELVCNECHNRNFNSKYNIHAIFFYVPNSMQKKTQPYL